MSNPFEKCPLCNQKQRYFKKQTQSYVCYNCKEIEFKLKRRELICSNSGIEEKLAKQQNLQ